VSFGTYGALKTEVANWLNRADLTAQIPSFIELARVGFNTDADFRTREMTLRKTATLSAGDYRIALPTGWLDAINIQVTGANGVSKKLEYVTPGDMDNARATQSMGYVISTDTVPKYYNIMGSELEVTPTPGADCTFEMLYYAEIAAFSADSDTNWLLTKHPGAYLYGALMHAAPYVDDDARVQTWMAGYTAAVEGVKASDKRAMTSGGPLKRRFSSF
jgi:hypothetical protein